MKLYEIDQAILDCVDPDTGEVLDVDRLEALQMAREDKLEGVALWVKDLDAEADAIRAEEKALAERRKAKENKAASLRDYLSSALSGETMETARVRLSYRRSEGVNVTDEQRLLEYLINNHGDALKYPDPVPIKAELKKLLKSGEAIPGAELDSRQNLQIA